MTSPTKGITTYSIRVSGLRILWHPALRVRGVGRENTMLEKKNDCFYVTHNADKSQDTIVYGLGDVHFDAKGCDRDLLEEHLKQATEDGAGVVQVGDFFDVMNSTGDKRGSKGQLRSDSGIVTGKP